jgi:DNA-binding Xre family transcriptional regulator
MKVYISYKKLWHLLLDRNMNKNTLREQIGVSTASIAKLSKGKNVNTEILVKICHALDCNVSDIMDILPKDQGIEIENDRQKEGSHI